MGGAYVAVIGGSQSDADTENAAEEVGRLLAARGAVVVCGGREGVAEAVSRGAVGAGGTAVGILPGRTRDEANPFVTVAVPTGLGETRNALVVMDADAVIAFAGGYGTLSEIAHALLAGTRVVGLGTWRLEREPDGAEVPIHWASTPDEAVSLALDP